MWISSPNRISCW